MSHHLFKPLFVVLDDQILSQTTDDYTRYLVTIFNMYRAIVKKASDMVTYQQMEQVAQSVPGDRQIMPYGFEKKDLSYRIKSWFVWPLGYN